MTLGTMPDQIQVKALDSKASEYYADKMRLYDALYEGGEKFNESKKEFLPKRPIEKAQDTVGGNGHYESRLASAFYTNYAGGIIDWFSAKIVENNPRIVVGDGVKEDSRKYWESLNTDADGKGNPLVTVCRWAAREVIVNLRSYFLLDFPEPGSKDGRIDLLDAVTVDDWDKDPDGNMLWLRRHTQECVRNESAPWEQPTKEAHYWTFFDDEKIVVYRAERDIGARQWPQGVLADKVMEEPHNLGMPVFDIRSDKSLWIMDRIKEPVIKLFRREASLNWYLDSLCYQMPVFNLANVEKFDSIPVTPLGAVVLEIGESADFLTPNPGGFEPNFKAVEQCKKSFYESLQVLAKEAASIPQAGRLSGEAIESMQKPMEVLVGSFAWPIEDALARLIERLKEHRNEPDADIKIEGFGRVKVDEAELKEMIMEGDDGRGTEENGPEGEESPGTESE
jgi:hypothetical protein